MSTTTKPAVQMPLAQLKLVIAARLLLANEIPLTPEEASLTSDHLSRAIYALCGRDPSAEPLTREDAMLMASILAQVLEDASNGLYEAHFAQADA